MIAWASNATPGVEIVDRGYHVVILRQERTEFPSISRYDLQQPLPVKKGFRTPPLNPRKRIKSKKLKA